MFKFAERVTKRACFYSSTWRTNSTALLYTREVKPQNEIKHFYRKNCSSPTLLPKGFNGLKNFPIESERTLYLKSQVRLNSFFFNPKNGYILCRKFHLSEPRKAAPILPVIGAFLARFSGPIAQLLKLMAVVAGR